VKDQDVIEELRKRSVFRATVVYCVVAWLLLQVADVTFDQLPIPDGAMTVLIVLAILGLPVTVVLAWAYDITIRGIVRHEETRGGAPRLAFLPFILLVIAVGGGLTYGLYYLSLDLQEEEPPALAVLPFVNMSAAEDAEYFSDGLTEEIRNLMVRLNEFRVVALSSAYELKDKAIDIPTIAQRRRRPGTLVGVLRPKTLRHIRDPGEYCAPGSVCPANHIAGIHGTPPRKPRYRECGSLRPVSSGDRLPAPADRPIDTGKD
jgi:hypothetical protein